MWQDDEQKISWPARIFLIGGMLVIVTGLFYFIFGPKDPAYDWRRPGTIQPTDYTKAGIGDSIVLAKDRESFLPKLKLVYRGLDNGRLFIEVTLMELDPDYAYRYRINPEGKKPEFQMGGRVFRLDSWNRSRISLELIR